MLKGKGKYLKLEKGGGRVYIPSKIIYDSQFPFKTTSEVEINVENNKVVITKNRITKSLI